MELTIKILLMSLLLLISSIANSSVASWYGKPFHGRKTASGEVFNMNAMTCASNTHKMGTKLLVTNKENGKSVVVKVNDTGGFKKYGRTLDLSKGAFLKLADLKQGTINIKIKVIK